MSADIAKKSVTSQIEEQVRARLAELEPYVAEYRQLEEVARTFERVREDVPETAPRPARKRGSTRARKTPTGGGRAEQALKLVAESPGITVPQLADQMGIGPTYLYRVMPGLEKDGKVRKHGAGYHPA